MSVTAFWLLWLVAGMLAAAVWLQDACPAAACSFVIVLLQAPMLLIGALVWLVLGILASLIVTALKHRTPDSST